MTVADVSKLVAQQKAADDPAFTASNQILFLQGSEVRLNTRSTLREVGIVRSCTLVDVLHQQLEP